MPYTLESLAYEVELLQKALDGDLKITLTSSKKATALRARLYAARSVYRKESERRFDPSDSRWRKSPWDDLTIQIEGSELQILTKERASGILGIEQL